MKDKTAESVPCKRCGTPTIMQGTGLCNRCWKVERHLSGYLSHPRGLALALRLMLDLHPPGPNEAERLARFFHATYERLAPEFAYSTRKASAVPWDQVPENNRNLMIATCRVVLEQLGVRHTLLLHKRLADLVESWNEQAAEHWKSSDAAHSVFGSCRVSTAETLEQCAQELRELLESPEEFFCRHRS